MNHHKCGFWAVTLCLWLIAGCTQGPIEIALDPSTLESYTNAIAEHKGRNLRNLEALNAAADTVKQTFEELGLETDEFVFKVRGREFRNIIAKYGEQKGPPILIGAHYDVAGDMHGADDNASGVAGLMALAKLLSENKPTLNYPIQLVAFTNEEPPFFGTPNMGSARQALYLRENNQPVALMISLEMIGYFSEEPNSQTYPVKEMEQQFPTTGNFICIAGRPQEKPIADRLKKSFARASTLESIVFLGDPQQYGLDFSDHRNFWLYEYPALMVTDTSFYRNPHYHEPTDMVGTLDFVKMAEVVKGVYAFILTIK